jgi:heat-inducible transcriptional repressor
VSDGGYLSHRVIQPAETYGSDELVHAANYLNTEFKGLPLTEVRRLIIELLKAERTLYDELVGRALRLASHTFDGLDPQPSIFIQGTALLFDIAAGEDPETTLHAMRSLLLMIEEKTRLVQLLDACMDNGLSVIIGTEHADRELQSFSVVTSTYTDGRRRGAVGIIGPTRMRYSRAINVVDSLSRTINRVLDNS